MLCHCGLIITWSKLLAAAHRPVMHLVALAVLLLTSVLDYIDFIPAAPPTWQDSARSGQQKSAAITSAVSGQLQHGIEGLHVGNGSRWTLAVTCRYMQVHSL